MQWQRLCRNINIAIQQNHSNFYHAIKLTEFSAAPCEDGGRESGQEALLGGKGCLRHQEVLPATVVALPHSDDHVGKSVQESLHDLQVNFIAHRVIMVESFNVKEMNSSEPKKQKS